MYASSSMQLVCTHRAVCNN